MDWAEERRRIRSNLRTKSRQTRLHSDVRLLFSSPLFGPSSRVFIFPLLPPPSLGNSFLEGGGGGQLPA